MKVKKVMVRVRTGVGAGVGAGAEAGARAGAGAKTGAGCVDCEGTLMNLICKLDGTVDDA
jgi:hypothetical protein